MQQAKWIERKFNFGYKPDHLPFFIERLNCTLPRIKDIVQELSEEQLRYQTDGKWCIKEHIGHLSDLEELHERRLDDLMEKKTVLSAADMTNKATNEADHIHTGIETLISDFATDRKRFLDKVKTFTPAQVEFRSLHPRLKEEINVVDLLYFLAEHDTAHLVHMANLAGPSASR